MIEFHFHKYEANKTNDPNEQKSKNSTKTAIENEFVSDTFKTTEKDLDEVKAGLKLLGIDSLAKQANSNDGKLPRTRIKI